MTVISAMRFNKKEGAIVADEESSTGQRKFEIATKLHEFKVDGTLLIAGGSGASDFLYEVMCAAQKALPTSGERPASSLAVLLSNHAIAARRLHTDLLLKGLCGISEEEFQAGKRTNGSPMAKELQEIYLRIITGQTDAGKYLIENGILAIGRDAHDTQIYGVSTTGAVQHVARPYDCTGMGKDQADSALAEFFDTVPREERERIPPVKGIEALLHATDRAVVRNVGVGGTPLIKIIREDGTILTPNENNSRLAMELVRVGRKGYLPEDKRYELLDHLLFRDGAFEQVEALMQDLSTRKREMNLFLRGYKV